MGSDRAPSSRFDADQQKKLEAAQGDLRDAVGSVHNLARLLANVRVGPRAVEAVLPDVRAASRSIEHSAETLLDLIAPHLDDRAPASELLSWTRTRTQELADELAAAEGKPVHAKQRLHLEHVLRRLSRELEAARALIELLDASLCGPAVQLELAELVREAIRPEDSAGVAVRLSPDFHGDVLLCPRVALGLVGIGARWVAEQSETTPTLSVKQEGPDSSTLHIAPGGDTGVSPVVLAAPELVELSLACARAAAHASGTELSYDADRRSFTLTWPG